MAPSDRDTLKLDPEQLRWHCPCDQLTFETTAEIDECPISVIGQPRAVEAIQLGLTIQGEGYNVFCAGEVGTGRSTAVRQTLAGIDTAAGDVPEDLIYVHNFKDRDRPRLLAFPAGSGRRFCAAMDELVDAVSKGLPELFESELYQERRNRTIEVAKEAHKALLTQFEEQVEGQGFTLVQVQAGPIVQPGLMPVVAGNPVDMDQLDVLTSQEKFSKEDFDKIRVTHAELQGQLEGVFKEVRKIERALRKELQQLDRELARPLVGDAVDEVLEEFRAEEVKAYLDEAREDFLSRLDQFRGLAEAEAKPGHQEELHRAWLEATTVYRANLIVDNSNTEGKPVVWETSPNPRNLFGIIELNQTAPGIFTTNHTMIRSGSLLEANGGYLVLDALDVMVEEGVWPALKRTLRTRELEIHGSDLPHLLAPRALTPEPIQLDVKVVMIGTKQIYRILHALDEDFRKIFKVKAEFALWAPISEEEIRNYVCFVHKKVGDDHLPPFHRDAVVGVIEHGARLSGRQHRLTTRFKEVADLIRESAYQARQAGAEVVKAEHVDTAQARKRFRHDLVEETLRERIADGSILLDLEGKKVGQVNGLVVLDVGDYAFGQPSRITASTAMGRAGIIDIERESKMAGSIHTKGVLILAGFLRHRFAQQKPLALSASLAFEQSYGMVDGDSASAAELLALISSLAEAPIDQAIAVTGSVNQRGEIQPIGGVNEKVEGYFDLCALEGLTGKQGVMIPRRNVPDLMLRKDVVTAVKEGRFHVYAVCDVEEGIRILTGEAPGERGADGAYPDGSVFGKVDTRLLELAEGVEAFGKADKAQ